MIRTTLLLAPLLIGLALGELSFNCNTMGNDFEEITYKKGEKLIVCVHFLPFGVKVAYEIEVDKYVSLALRRGYDAMSEHDTDLFLQLENSEYFTNLSVS